MRSRSMRRCGTSCRRPRATNVGSLVPMGRAAACADCRSMACVFVACVSIASISATGRSAASTVIAASAIIHKSMSTPAVAVAPSSPWAHAQEYPVIEVSRAIKTNRGASIRSIVVVSVRTYRLNADADNYLSIRRRRQRAHGSDREQSARYLNGRMCYSPWRSVPCACLPGFVGWDCVGCRVANESVRQLQRT